MIAHKISTTIGSDGYIHLPEELRHLYMKKVEVILLFSDNKQVHSEDSTNKDIENFINLLNEYNAIEEPDLEQNLIYNHRKNQNERKFDFN